MAVMDQEARSDFLSGTHALKHHVEAEYFHIPDAPTPISGYGDPKFRPIVRSVKLYTPGFSVKFFNDGTEPSDRIVYNGTSFIELLP
jgi:hypothetical protein